MSLPLYPRACVVVLASQLPVPYCHLSSLPCMPHSLHVLLSFYAQRVFPLTQFNPCPCSAGSVCLDVINQTWSPMFDLVNVFEVFLPQLLLYPNPADPLNGEAASLLMREPQSYNQRVRGEWGAAWAACCHMILERALWIFGCLVEGNPGHPYC